jgi:hypothetical protein
MFAVSPTVTGNPFTDGVDYKSIWNWLFRINIDYKNFMGKSIRFCPDGCQHGDCKPASDNCGNGE